MSKLGEPCPKVRLSQDRLPIEPFAMLTLHKCHSRKCRFVQMSLNLLHNLLCIKKNLRDIRSKSVVGKILNNMKRPNLFISELLYLNVLYHLL